MRGRADAARPWRSALTPWELVLLAALACWMLVPLIVLRAHASGGVFNGAYGLQVDDQFQYLSFVREAGEHGLVSNRFDTVADPRLFLHPMFLVSGLLWKLGASLQLAFLMWQPIAAGVLFAATAAYVRRLLGAGAAAGIALLLALFFFTPATPLAQWLGGDEFLRFGTLVMGLELFPAGYPWSGTAGTIGIALMPVFLLGVERTLDPARRAAGRGPRWYLGWTTATGVLVSWLHPWQGITLLVMLGGLWAWSRFDRRLLVLALPAALTAAPLAYYALLSRTDSSWAQFSGSNGLPHVGWWFVLGLAPALLALPALRARDRGRDLDLQERLLRLWPVATLLVYAALNTSWIYQALAGMTVPLAILAVRSARALGIPRPAVALALAAVTLPGMVFLTRELAAAGADHFFTPSDRAALSWLDRAPRPGPVLAQQRLAQAVPGFAGRATWVGHYQWTPDYAGRLARVNALFAGQLAPADAQRVVTDSGAAFVLAGCRTPADLLSALGVMVTSTRRIGCATVYEIGRGA